MSTIHPTIYPSIRPSDTNNDNEQELKNKCFLNSNPKHKDLWQNIVLEIVLYIYLCVQEKEQKYQYDLQSMFACFTIRSAGICKL